MTDAVEPIRSSYLTGRLSPRPGGQKLQLVIDGKPHSLAAIENEGDFSIPLPKFVFDGQLHEIRARTHGEPDWLPGCPVHFRSDFLGYAHMEPFVDGLVSGWAVDLSRPGTAVEIEILLNSRAIAVVTANEFREHLMATPDSSGRCGFTYRIEGDEELTRSSVIRARVHGTHFDLRGSPILFLDTSRFLNTVRRVNSAFRFLNERTLECSGPSGPELELSREERVTFADFFLGGANLAELLELGRWFQQASADHGSASSHRHRFFTYLTENHGGSGVIRHPAVVDSRVDVIFHVDLASVEADGARVAESFQRVIASPAEPPFSVVCVMDGLVAEDFRARLASLASGHDVIFVENAERAGFAASCNGAAGRFRDRDLVVLDPRCLVFGNWLERLRSAAYGSPAVGIVSPFATAGDICGYSAGSGNCVDFARLDALAAAENGAAIMDMPAAQGVCAYIRRACLDEVGAFEQTIFQSRDLVFTDFTLRAASRGWRTVLAAGTLVETVPANPDLDGGRQALDACHPYFADLLVNFRLDDPARTYRRRLDLAVIRELGRPIVCFLTHNLGGGTERHVRDLCAALDRNGFEALVIFALDRRSVSVSAPRLPSLSNVQYRLNGEFPALVDDLSRLDIRRFHIHSNIGIHEELLRLPARLGIDYDCTVHDYSWFCPRVNLIDSSGIYCGEPSAAACDDCLGRGAPPLWVDFSASYRDAADLRAKSREVLSGARNVFCPSRDTKFRMARQVRIENLIWKPNPEPAPGVGPTVREGGRAEIGVALIGLVSRRKGMDVLFACAQAALRDRMPLRFHVVGFTEDDKLFDGLPNVTITGRYKEGEAGTIIRNQKISVCLFPSVWPETYSYTLSIALNCGLFPVAFDLGAIAERIREAKFGKLIPLESSPEEINAALLAPVRQGARPLVPDRPPEAEDPIDYYYPGLRQEADIGVQNAK